MRTPYDRGVYVGRFQPLHLGHMECIRYVLYRCREIIVVIGSAQASHTLENPFTAGERVEMIRLALQENNVDLNKFIIVPVEDTVNNNHSIWVSKVRSLIPKFNVVFTNSPLTKRLFEEEKIKVEGIPYINRQRFSGTIIRRMIIEGDEGWKELVPKSVYEYIIEIKGDERLKELAKKDI
ncbi:MAG: nicotinamide-nucleotide adenylyltransferase [Candidatus Methanomethylicia archaeon]|nr:nicotinamide-nucleotide adenylyltransferase [Candidatus Methanomethylicia archaeon]MCX8169337.1 nicotinamide-nucleotide adenylyltransferase [Candidatus Methanomethylicia archaeon]MDW7988880.1 nicotinamide-nucleotide adenylyltransferase [Nitrososphaerota archaeon]